MRYYYFFRQTYLNANARYSIKNWCHPAYKRSHLNFMNSNNIIEGINCALNSLFSSRGEISLGLAVEKITIHKQQAAETFNAIVRLNCFPLKLESVRY